MKFKLLLKSPQLLSILHNVLMNETTKNKTFNIIDNEEYTYNQYSLLIVMDIVIKYQIIINDETYHKFMVWPAAILAAISLWLKVFLPSGSCNSI